MNAERRLRLCKTETGAQSCARRAPKQPKRAADPKARKPVRKRRPDGTEPAAETHSHISAPMRTPARTSMNENGKRPCRQVNGACPRPKTQGKPRIKMRPKTKKERKGKARKNQASLDSTAQTGRQADNDRGRNHRGVEEGRQTHRGEREKKNGRAAGKRPENAGIKNKEQRHRRANGLRTALCLSAAKTGATGAVALRRANDAARGKGEKTSRQNACQRKPKTKERATPAQGLRKRGRRLGAQHSPPRAQQRQKPRAAAPRRWSMDYCTTFGRPRARTLPEGTYPSTFGCLGWAIFRTTNSRFADSF